MSNPSVDEANKVVRVLNGERLKFTCRVHFADGSILEFQANDRPGVKWCEEYRGLTVNADGYSKHTICRFPEGAVLLVEENK